MAENNYFGIDSSSIVEQLSAVYGFYPVSRKGLWHGGIHVKADGNKLVESPVSGEIVVYEPGLDKEESFCVIKKTVKIPTEKSKSKDIVCYSAISHLKSLEKYKKLVDYKKKLADKATEEDIALLKNGLPLGVTAKVDTSVSNCSCWKLTELKQKKYENSELYLNLPRTKAGDGYSCKSQDVHSFPDCTFYNKGKLFEPFKIKEGGTEVAVIPKEAPVSIEGNKFSVSDLYVEINKKFKAQTGYIYADDIRYKINPYGNIVLDNLSREENITLSKWKHKRIITAAC